MDGRRVIGVTLPSGVVLWSRAMNAMVALPPAGPPWSFLLRLHVNAWVCFIACLFFSAEWLLLTSKVAGGKPISAADGLIAESFVCRVILHTVATFDGGLHYPQQ